MREREFTLYYCRFSGQESLVYCLMITVIMIELNDMVTEMLTCLQQVFITWQGTVDIGYTVVAVNSNNGIGTVDKNRIEGILAFT
jgi:hypothetical protein